MPLAPSPLSLETAWLLLTPFQLPDRRTAISWQFGPKELPFHGSSQEESQTNCHFVAVLRVGQPAVSEKIRRAA
jgi:hypothetical protein